MTTNPGYLHLRTLNDLDLVARLHDSTAAISYRSEVEALLVERGYATRENGRLLDIPVRTPDGLANALALALAGMADTGAQHFTCTEADLVAAFIRSRGYTREGDIFLACHAAHDEEGDNPDHLRIAR